MMHWEGQHALEALSIDMIPCPGLFDEDQDEAAVSAAAGCMQNQSTEVGETIAGPGHAVHWT